MYFFGSIVSMDNYGQECISQQNSHFGSCKERVQVMVESLISIGSATWWNI